MFSPKPDCYQKSGSISYKSHSEDFSLLKSARKMLSGQEMFCEAEDVPHARSVIKGAYLKPVSGPEDKQLSFYSQPSKKDKSFQAQPKPVMQDAGSRLVCQEGGPAAGLSLMSLVAINSAW